MTLSIASISDIHLGHAKNTSSRIINNLEKAFPYNSETADLDIIFIPGDVFDKLLYLPDTDVKEIDIWIVTFLQRCAKYDILVRIIEGTPSHEWNQSERFITIANMLNIGVDIKYVSTISVEYIEKFNINVLYIPDKATESPEVTLEKVKEIITAKGLKTVDYALMHGQFEFQLPPMVKAEKHSSDEYLKLVTGLIFVGHVHTFSTNDRIIAQGSFDRLAHGEEEAKGHVRAYVSDKSKTKITFVENKDALVFKSIDCDNLSLEETFELIDSVVTKLPEDAHIRVCGNSANPIFSNINVLIRKYPLLTWSKLIKDMEEEIIQDDADSLVDEYIPVTITKENIRELLINRVSRFNPSPVLLNNINNILDDVLLI